MDRRWLASRRDTRTCGVHHRPNDVAKLCAKVLDMKQPRPGTLDRPYHVCAVCGERIDANEAFVTYSWDGRSEYVHLICMGQRKEEVGE